MKITFTGTYKSLTNFKSDELTPFSVITGKNGSGKSQLIEIIEQHSESNVKEYSILFEPKFNKNKIVINNIQNNNIQIQRNDDWVEKNNFNYKNLHNDFGIKNSDSINELFFLLVEHDCWIEELYDKSFLKIYNNHDGLNELLKRIIDNEKSFKSYRNSLLIESENSIEENINILQTYLIVQKSYENIFRVNYNVAKYRNKKPLDLEYFDYYKTPIEDIYIDYPDLFTRKIDSLFYNYCKRRDLNSINFLNKKVYGDKNEAVSDEEFIEMHKQPWHQINQIFEKRGLDFAFIGIEREDFSSDIPIRFQFKKKSVNKNINLDDLSSGEKIIIGLIIKLFIAKYYNENLEAPELIILDEPDSHLHPEMSKLLIDVLNETFVKEFGIKVIMTTHSPSTIALCPEDSIYELKNSPETSLKKVTKDYALDLLTGFIPTLSIDYKNHKQVFVESPTDVEYYTIIFNKLNQDNKYPFNLYFISNSNGKGSCDLVESTVEQIRKSGNKTSFGIIDYDLKNKSSEFIKVQGEDKVYSIENYIYNPIYLAVYFMQEKGANNIFKELGIEETVNYFNIGFKNDEYLQRISDWFFEKYYARFTIKDDEKVNLVEFYFYNKSKIKVPKWFLEFKGHDVEKQLKEIFPSLKNHQKSEGELQKEIIKVIAKCYPLIPQDSVDLIESLTK